MGQWPNIPCPWLTYCLRASSKVSKCFNPVQRFVEEIFLMQSVIDKENSFPVTSYLIQMSWHRAKYAPCVRKPCLSISKIGPVTGKPFFLWNHPHLTFSKQSWLLRTCIKSTGQSDKKQHVSISGSTNTGIPECMWIDRNSRIIRTESVKRKTVIVKIVLQFTFVVTFL